MSPDHSCRLSHIYPRGKILFVTWHLHGCLPSSMAPPPGELASDQAFAWMDRHLDTLRTGPLYLRQPAIAAIVVHSIHKGVELGHYDLHAYVVMANHVHMLIQPKVSPRQLLKSLKGATAREANKALCRTGEPFWQKESYDHWVRDEGEFRRIRAYIENNPVEAGLVNSPAEFFWSSAGVERSLSYSRRGTHECFIARRSGNDRNECKGLILCIRGCVRHVDRKMNSVRFTKYTISEIR